MPEKESKTNVTHDDFVGKIVKDPKSPPDTILLTGYLGKSSEDGHTRLYFDPELKSYVEIPNEAILHSQQISPEQSGLGGSNVWIKSDAEVIHGKVGPSRTKAKFFEGPIAAAAAAAGAGAGPGPLPPTLVNCPSHAPFLCPQTVLPPCPPSPVPHCLPTPAPLMCPHTVLPPCPVTIHCTVPPQCFVTHVFTQCPTPLHGCPPPPPTPLCTQVFTHCATPLHGCPPPPTPLCHTPLHGCPTPPALCLPSIDPQICPPSVHGHLCPVPSALIPCQTQQVVACIPHLTQNQPQCVASPAPACGGFPGGPGGPVEQGFAAQAVSQFCPSHPIVCVPSPICPPSAHHICPTNPAFCHHTLPHICLTNPVICRPSPFCPSPFCPSPACPSIHIGCPQSPFCPVTPGCGFGPGGGGGPQI
jgi:hypothetical protein